LLAQSNGLPTFLILVVMVVMNLFYALAVYPAGVRSDKGNRFAGLQIGLLLLVAADVTLAHAQSIATIAVGVSLWGLHMGFTQALLSALVADSAPPALRGAAFGLFHLATGIALLVASVFAGLLWKAAVPQATFLGGAGFALIAMRGFVLVFPHRER
jgi:hypothetical protein